MDWANEEYVKVYRRETDDDLLLSWQALALWRAMLLKFDRAGVIETRRGARGLAALVRIPVDVVESALPELLDDGRLQIIPRGYFAPNFLAAQEARKSDKQRQRESRQRRAWEARQQATRSICGAADIDVTDRDPTSHDVTGDHTASQPVTLSSADPDPDPDPERLAARVRAIQPSTPSVAAYDADSPADRGALAERTYWRVSEARVEMAVELGLPEQLPFQPITPSSRPQAFSELLDRVREEGPGAPRACDRVVENLISQARHTREIEWLSQKAFSSGAWRTAREGDVPASRKAARAGPRAHDPSVGRVEPHQPEEYASGDVKL